MGGLEQASLAKTIFFNSRDQYMLESNTNMLSEKLNAKKQR